MPTVSVIIPTYNNKDMVVDAIESVLAQTCKDFEIIVVDDGSTDETGELLAKYTNRIIYIYQKNSHISVARNNGFRASKGKYIAQLDADDLWLPEKLDKQIVEFERHPEAGLVYCDSYICNYGKEDDRQITFSRHYIKPREGNVFPYFFKANPLCTSSAVIARDVWEKAGGLDESLRGGQDAEFFMRISAFAPVYYCPEPLMIYRKHSANTSSAVTSSSNARTAFKKNIAQRRSAIRNLTKAGQKLPLTVLLFERAPQPVRYLMFFWWRFRFGSNPFHSMKIAYKYLGKLFGLRTGGKDV